MELKEDLETPQGVVVSPAGPAKPRSRWEGQRPGATARLTFDNSDVLYLVAGVVVGGPQLAHVDALVAGGEALQVEAHQVLVHGDVGSAAVDVLGDADGAVDDVLPVVLGDAELVGQGVVGFVLVAAVHAQVLAQQAGAQVLDHLAVGSLEDWERQEGVGQGAVSSGDARAASRLLWARQGAGRGVPVRMTAMPTVGFISLLRCPVGAVSERGTWAGGERGS